jgi:hypothetical protein
MKDIIKDKQIADINAISDWIYDAKKGHEIEYFVGEMGRAREINARKEDIRESANFVWAMYTHKYITLKQRRGEEIAPRVHNYHYIMERTGVPRK